MLTSSLLLLASLGTGLAQAQLTLDDLYLNNAPSSPRPYVIPHYANSHAVTIDSQLYRFTVTGPSSGYAFTLMSTNAPSSGSLGVLPHIHRKHYENFFSFKGRFQLWAQKGDNEQQAQILDPDTEMVGVIVPGGFDVTGTFSMPSAQTIPLEQTLRTFLNQPIAPPRPAQELPQSLLDFNPRRDLINGTAPVGDSDWHTAANDLGTPGQPYFIANGYGPKYLNSQHGYQIVQPLVSPKLAQDTNYTLSTLTISRQTKDNPPQWNLAGAAAVEVLEGVLSIKIGDYPVAQLNMGDVAFIPAHVSFTYYCEAAFTKVLYVRSGTKGVDQQLICGGMSWDFVTFPKY
ncbi:hypothetical protein PoHVEF18_009885 [Penicillium ochrochloron]